MVAVHFTAFEPRDGMGPELGTTLATLASKLNAAGVPGLGRAWAGVPTYNADRAAPYTHVLYIQADSKLALDDYEKDEGAGGKIRAAVAEAIGKCTKEALVASFEPEHHAKAGQLIHLVAFEVNPAQQGKWTEGAEIVEKNSVKGSGKLPVKVLYAGPVTGKGNKHVNHVLFTEFESKDALDKYSPAPEHHKAAHEYLLPASNRATVKAFDFVPVDTPVAGAEALLSDQDGAWVVDAKMK
ncbi:hypothetical protein DFJ74DRAFT_692828 [Hyaloraphidium curvatum]|nr:hypothetical protein DFJ74DRAFT_692828 [Hyaloraphidium curvatum]